MSDTSVVVKMKVEGAAETMATLAQLSEALVKLNEASGGAQSASRPFGAASYAPAAPSPYSATSGIGLPYNAREGVSPSSASGNTTNPASASQNALYVTATTMYVSAQNVTILGNVAGSGGPGAAHFGLPAFGSGVGSGTGGGGNGGFLGWLQNLYHGMGGGAPSAPGMPAPSGGSGYWSGVMGPMTGGALNPGGALRNAALNAPEAMGLSPWVGGVAGLAYGAALFSDNAYLAYTAPGFRAHTQISSAALAGNPMAPFRQQYLMATSALQAQYDEREALGGWTRAVPFFGRRFVEEQRQIERHIAETRALEERDASLKRLIAYGASGAGLRMDHLYKVGDNWSAEGRVNTIAQSMAFVGAAGLGMDVQRTMGNYDYQNLVNQGLSPEDAYRTVAPIQRYMLQTPDILTAFRYSGVGAASALTLRRAAMNGDLGTLNQMWPGASNEDRASASDLFMRGNELRVAGGIAGSYTSSAGSYLGYLQSTGGSTTAVRAAYGGVANSLSMERTYLQQQLAMRDPSDTVGIASLRASIDQLTAHIATLGKQSIEYGFSQRGLDIQSSLTSAATGYASTLYGGGDESALSSALSVRSSTQRAEAQRLREMSRSTVYSPEQRRSFATQAQQMEQQAGLMTERERSSMYFGIASGRAGVAGAEAGAAVERAGLFGGPRETQEGLLQQAGSIRQNMAAIEDYMRRGNLSLQERLQLEQQLTSLKVQEVSVTERAYRAAAQQEISVAGGRVGIASTEYSNSIMRGAGGLTAQQELFGILDKSGSVVKKSQDYVDLLRSRGVSDDNPEMVQALQQLATARSQQTGAELGLASAPPTLDIQRGLSSAQYRASVLQTVPGAYGNLRGALQQEVQLINRAAQQKQAEYAAAKQRYGGKLPPYLDYRFQQEFQQLGLQQAQAYHQLSYGWESRLISQTLGAPGNQGFIANQFTFRDAVQNGAMNPHMGATANEVPMWLQQANLQGSIAGATGTPEGFALTAMAGAKPNDRFGDVAGIPQFMGDTAQPGGEQVIRIEITLRNPDGSEAGNVTRRISRGSLGANEDAANLFTRMAAGNGW
jgi:hypothetical protein